MKNKILKTLLAVSIAINVGGAVHYNNVGQHNNTTISILQDNVKTKSTKIAKLGDVIKLQNERVLQQQQVIDSSTKTINELENKAKQLQAERDKALAENFKKQQEGSDGILTLTMNASGYMPMCNEGCSGKTRSGYDVRNTVYYNGMRIIASDLSVLPMYSIVEIEGFSGRFIVLDTGGAINGNKIDILFNSTNEAIKFGRKNVKVKVIRSGQ